MPSHNATLTRLLMHERPSLLRMLRRVLGSRPAAEDVAQTLYLKIAKLDDAVEIQHHRAFLFRLASNLATDQQRAQEREQRLQREVAHLLWAEALSAERSVLAQHELDRVACALAALPEPTRGMFCLNRFEGISQQEIAQRYGVSTTLVERHMRRALDALSKARNNENTRSH